MKLHTCITIALLAVASFSFGQFYQSTSNLISNQIPYPGIRASGLGTASARIYGTEFAWGETPTNTYLSFINNQSQAIFHVPSEQLVYDSMFDVMQNKYVVGHYKRVIDGLPVEGQKLSLMVKNAPGYPLIWVSSSLYNIEGVQLNTVVLTPDDVVNLAYENPLPGMVFEQPELLITNITETPTKAYRIVGDNHNLAIRFRRAYYYNAENGELLGVRDLIRNVNINGTVQGYGQANTLPDVSYNLPTLNFLTNLLASVNSSVYAYSDSTGAFVIPYSGSGSTTVSALLKGNWVIVNNVVGAELTASVVVIPPGPAQLVFNSSPSGANTSQVNGYYWVTATHNFVKRLVPTYPADEQLTCNVNINSNCNAYYDGASLNFYIAGGGCPNTAYSTVISHEYGHFLIDRAHPSATGDYHEGQADAVAILLVDDYRLGRDFQGSGTMVRNLESPEAQYPNGTEVHTQGIPLGQSWWDLKKSLQTKMGAQAGLDYTATLMLNLNLMQPPALDPNITIDVLTLDDNDGNIYNGTPNYTQIAAAFGAHNLDAPPVDPVGLSLSTPDDFGYPDRISTAVLTVTPLGSQPNLNNMKLYLAVNGGSYTVYNLNPANPTLVVFPAQAQGTRIKYYIAVQGTDGTYAYYPSGGSANPAKLTYAYGYENVLTDNFETNMGWTTTADASVTAGSWERTVPVGVTNSGVTVAPFEDNPNGTGTNCFVTDNRTLSGNAGYGDVDGGPVRLTSPSFNMTGDGVISYYRWFYCMNNGTADSMVVEISNNNGSTWTTVETIPFTGSENQWVKREFQVSEYITPSSQMKLRFTASDNPNDSLTEAAIDDVVIKRFLPTVSFTGVILPSSYMGDKSQIKFELEFRNPSTGFIVKKINLQPDINGNFSNTAPIGTYNVALKAERWLRVILPNITFPYASTLQFNLDAIGDTNNDNAIDDFDLNDINGSFGGPAPLEQPAIDLNGDGIIDDFDLNIVNGAFGSIGAE